MSWSDVAVAAVAVACFNLLWWTRTLSRRLGHIERTTKTDPRTGLGSGHWLEKAKKLGGDRAIVVPAAAQAGERSLADRPSADARDNIPSPITDEPRAERIAASVLPRPLHASESAQP